MIDIIPGIILIDTAELEKKIRLLAPHVSWVHIYLSDGSMGTPSTLTDVSGLATLLSNYRNLSFEAHLLTANPEKYVRSLADVGFKRIIAHAESNDPRRFFEEAKYDEVELGVAIDGATELEQAEPFLEEVDFVVVMTAEAGVAGGTFLPEAVEKIKLIHQNYPDLPIEAVGGITDATVKIVKDAGASRIVATQFIFQDPSEVAQSIDALKQS